MTPEPQAVAYVRISLDKTGEGLGVTRQAEDATKLAEIRGWSLTETIVENSVSAAGKKQRQGFDRLIDLIESGEIQAVVAWALDRLTRNRRDTVRLIEACQQHSVTIALVRGSDIDLTTPSGRLTADLLAAIARSEIETKSDRQVRASAQARKMGLWTGGKRPFGYTIEVDPVLKRRSLSVFEPEARLVRTAYEMLLDGASLREIARQFNDEGFPTPQGNDWTGAVLSRTLRQPTYAGLRGDRVQRDDPRRAVVRDEEGNPVRAVWDPLVDFEVWQTAQTLMNDPSRARAMVGDQMLLTGLAHCGLCDAGIHSGGRRTKSGERRYRCASGGGHVNRMSRPVEDFVVQAILYRLGRPDAAELLAPADDYSKAKIKELNRESRQIQQRLSAVVDLFSDGEITAEDLKRQRARLQARLAGVEVQMPKATGRPKDLARLVNAEQIELVWESLTIEAQRDVIDTLATVTLYPPGPGHTKVTPEHVVIEWKQ